MSQIPQPSRVVRVLAPPLRPKPPAWVARLFSGAAAPADHPGRCGRQLTVCSTDRFSLISAAIDDPTDLSADELITAVSDVYRSLAAELARERRYPVRLWNFVPDIQERLGDGDRYMAFNVGRVAAYCDWFGGAEAFT